MIVYAESSAVLALLLGEPEGARAGEAMMAADIVVTSVLTGIECARGFARARTLRRISSAQLSALLNQLADMERRWYTLELTPDVAERSRGPVPVEPMRALDAIHLATMQLVWREAGEVAMLSLDERVRANATALGVPVLPALA